jgi:hypothetical protein
MVYAINQWRHYLQTSIPFEVVTDNITVTYIQSQTKLTSKQARWIQLLGEFNFTIHHRPGTTNVVADGLSRKDILGISVLSNTNWLDTIQEITQYLPPIKGLTYRNGLAYKGHKLFIPAYRDIKTRIINENHDVNGAHFGYKKTLSSVQQSYYWKRLPQDVKLYVQSCDACQRNKPSTQKPYGLLQPIEPPLDKFQTYSMDFIGPLPRTPTKENGILVIVDTLTKAVSLEAIQMTYNAADIAKIFYKRIFTRFGIPTKIISDRDPRFTGAFWRRLLELTNTKLALSTAYHPQSDGQTERTNRTLEQILRANVNYWQNDWHSHLPAAEFAINSSPNESTGFSPFELMYGKNPECPINLTDKEIRVPSAEDTVKKISEAISIARENIIRSQLNQKRHADKHRRSHKFQIGDQVMLDNRNLNPADR